MSSEKKQSFFERTLRSKARIESRYDENIKMKGYQIWKYILSDMEEPREIHSTAMWEEQTKRFFRRHGQN